MSINSIKTLLLVTPILLNYSCATILNQRDISIEIHSVQDSIKVLTENDSLVPTPVIIEVPRSDHDFKLTIKKDSTIKSVLLKNIVSPEFQWGNLLLVYLCPIGYIIDASSRSKIYGYNNSLLIDIDNKSNGYKNWIPNKSGQLFIKGSLPWFDFFSLDDDKNYKDYKAYMGLCAGFDLYYLKRTYISLYGGFTGISDIGFPVMDRFIIDTVNLATSISIQLTNNHDINLFSTNNIAFSIGYGFNYTRFHYKKVYGDTVNHNETILKDKYINSLGLSFDLTMVLWKGPYISLNILPSFYTFTKQPNGLPYLAHIDFGVKLPINKYTSTSITRIKYKPVYIE